METRNPQKTASAGTQENVPGHKRPAEPDPFTPESPSLFVSSTTSPIRTSNTQTTDAEAASGPAAKRPQVPRACDRCKRLRRGCSEYRPCKRCLDSGLASQCSSGATSIHLVSSNDSLLVFHRLAELVPGSMVEYCTDRFFDRLHPTIPILTREYVTFLHSAASAPDTGMESLCVLAGMCCQVLLQTEEPEALFHQGVIPEKNHSFGRLLLDALISTYQTLPRRSPISAELCLISFFLYACEAVLFHHSRSFRYLRETTTLILLFRTEDASEETQVIIGRLFWVLLISERSHAIRYRRPITLQITEDTPRLESDDPSLVGFWSLAALFRPIDTSFIALLNRELLRIHPSSEGLNNVELEVNSALRPIIALQDTQKANLRVTQLWLRVIIWQLRLHLGYLVEESYQRSLTFRYPIDVARELVLSTRDLPVSSFTVHGMGMTEKLFDIASALVDVLARIPLAAGSPPGSITRDNLPQHDLSYLRQLISQLPGGKTIFDDLLEKHVQQTVPTLAGSHGDSHPLEGVNS